MGTYVGKVQIGDSNRNLSPIASTMFYRCDSLSRDIVKIVNFDKFDRLVHGVTIFVCFTNGNELSNNIQLQVGSTLAYDITGNCVCGENEVIAFTFDEVDATHKYWRVTSSGITSAMRQFIIDTINNTSETPDVLIIKGSIGTGGNPGILPNSDYEKGWTYYVVHEGEYLGQYCEPGALIIAIHDAIPNQSSINSSHWAIITTSSYSNGTGLDLNLSTNEFSVIYGSTAGTAAEGNDPRLSDARVPLDHRHGNISASGELGDGNTLVRTNDGVITTGPIISDNPVDANKYLNNLGQWAEPNYPVLSVNGRTGEVVITLAEFGLTAMRFIGQATVTIQEGSSTDPEIRNYSWPNDRVSGDVILGNDNGREYIWSGTEWIMLGFSASEIMDSNAITGQNIIETDIPTWISRITQSTDGTIRVERSTIGILPISHGGTGNYSFTNNEVILSGIVNNTPQLISRAYTDNIDATALTISNNFITEESVYYGLPFINGVHNYSSYDSIFVPITTGTQYQILISDGQATPQWANAAFIDMTNAHNTNLILGNTLTTGNHSDGIITLYSHGSGAHLIQGDTINGNIIEHTFQNIDGYILQSESSGAVGSETQPIYIDDDGLATAIEYTANRLYYSASTTSFEATNHYADEYKVGINIINWPNNNTDALYVYGSATINSTNENNNTIISATSQGAGALKVIGGVYINDNLYVETTSILMGNVGIGDAPESGLNSHILYVYGSTNLDGTVDITGITTITDNTSATINGTGALIITGGIYTEDSIFAEDNLHIGNISTFLGNVSIGEEVNGNASEILTINGSTKIKGENNIVGYLNIETTNLTDILSFEPYTTGTGLIGNDDARWQSAAFSDNITVLNENNGVTINSLGFINILNEDSSINFSTIENNNEVGIITISTEIPTILLDTTTNQASDWIMTNTSGTFSLNNRNQILIELKGTNSGFELTNRLYINENIPLTNAYVLYIGSGDTYSDGNIIPSLDENDEPDKTLGSTTNRWAHVYIGDKDTHGDEFTPVYWNDGVPHQVPVVQKYDFSIANASQSTTIELTNTYNTFAIVNSIIVDSGISGLNGPLSWNIISNNNGVFIEITTTVSTSCAVSGYILVSTGIDESASPAINFVEPTNT